LLIRKKMEYEIRNSAVSLPKGLKEREQRLTKMMLIIFTVFIITYMPSYFVKTVTTVDLGYNEHSGTIKKCSLLPRFVITVKNILALYPVIALF